MQMLELLLRHEFGCRGAVVLAVLSSQQYFNLIQGFFTQGCIPFMLRCFLVIYDFAKIINADRVVVGAAFNSIHWSATPFVGPWSLLFGRVEDDAAFRINFAPSF